MFLKERTLPSAIVLRYILKVKKDSDDNSESFFVFLLVPKEAHIAFGNRTSMNIKEKNR